MNSNKKQFSRTNLLLIFRLKVIKNIYLLNLFIIKYSSIFIFNITSNFNYFILIYKTTFIILLLNLTPNIIF